MAKSNFRMKFLKTVDDLLRKRDLGREGHIAIFIEPVENDISDIVEKLELNLEKVAIPDDNLWQIPINGKKHPMKKKRDWHYYDIILPGGFGRIFAVYSTKIRKSEY